MTTTPAFLFDLDGTLVDSVYQHVLSYWDETMQDDVYLASGSRV